MIKYTRDEQERLHLQEALRVMLNILSNLNDVMHSTQIIGYSVCRKKKDFHLDRFNISIFCFGMKIG
jgi:hypothetical protein